MAFVPTHLCFLHGNQILFTSKAPVSLYSAFVGVRKRWPFRENPLGQIQLSLVTLCVECELPALMGMLSIAARGLAILLPPIQTFFVVGLFSPRAFILPNDLNTQGLYSNEDVNSSGYSRHAIVLPMLFSLPRILTSHFIKIPFILQGLTLISITLGKNSWPSPRS